MATSRFIIQWLETRYCAAIFNTKTELFSLVMTKNELAAKKLDSCAMFV